MNKLFHLFMVTALASAVLFTSCKKEEEPEPDPTQTCADFTFPDATGDAAIALKNFSSSTIQVEAGNILALAIEVTKVSSRPKKLRLFESDCENQLGTEIDLSDQPKGGKNGIDLRNTDDAQIRNVNYTVPTGIAPIYLTIQIDEGGGNTNYKRLTLNVSGSGLVDLHEGIVLGANANALPSRMNSNTGLTYASCNAAENIEYIDITYRVNTTAPYPMYLCSNPARFQSPVGSSTDPATATGCDSDNPTATSPTNGGQASYFAAYSGTLDPASAADADLEALTVSTSSLQYIEATAVGNIFEFMNPDGKKGLIEVTAIDQPNSTLGTITVSVVVQR